MRGESTGGAGEHLRRHPGALEDEVLAALWSLGGPASVGEVHEALGDGGLAYKTVLTVLTRLHDKGVLDRVRRGRAHAYTPRQAPADLAAERMTAVLSGRADRPEVLQRFLSRLGPEESAALRALMNQPMGGAREQASEPGAGRD
jgi:predicted transcriptional regulator